MVFISFPLVAVYLQIEYAKQLRWGLYGWMHSTDAKSETQTQLG